MRSLSLVSALAKDKSHEMSGAFSREIMGERVNFIMAIAVTEFL